MTPDELDRILSSDDSLEPSAGPELGYATLAVVASLALASLPKALFRR